MSTWQRTMDIGSLQARTDMTDVDQEWLARQEAGQACEIWEVDGGAEEMRGFTVVWVPEERVLWAFNCGLSPTWWGNVTHPEEIRTIGGGGTTPLHKLPYYVEFGARCDDCGRRLSAEQRRIAGILAETAGDCPYFSCDTCSEIGAAEIRGGFLE